MGIRNHWRDVYVAKSPEQVSWFEDSPRSSIESLEKVGLVPSRSIIDVGGGASRLADALLERGWHDITVIDIAETSLGASQERLGREAAAVKWLVGDIRNWRPDRPYDIRHDRAVFHFMTATSDRIGYKAALAAGTRAGSYVIIATFATDGPDMCSGLPVRRYDATGLAADLGPDFVPIDDWRETHVTPWGAEQPLQWGVFKRG